MKLPNYELATVPQRKITEYLLSPAHATGRAKAGFFSRFGYTAENWQLLASALLNHAAVHDVVKTEPSPFGTRYVIEGEFDALDGRKPQVRSIWFIGHNEQIPRFVSAYPLKGQRRRGEG
ncbi:MAG: hypothetical protein JNJ61_04750 [Anaerolineae bacterium]|nr:hypothetical protein [Anaerolineae bacterium]